MGWKVLAGIVASVLLVGTLLGGIWWFRRSSFQHEPVKLGLPPGYELWEAIAVYKSGPSCLDGYRFRFLINGGVNQPGEAKAQLVLNPPYDGVEDIKAQVSLDNNFPVYQVHVDGGLTRTSDKCSAELASVSNFFFKTKSIEGDVIKGIWTDDLANEAMGIFTLGRIRLLAPSNVRALASSANVTLNWEGLPGATANKIYVFKAKGMEILSIKETNRQNFVHTDIPKNEPLLFAVTSIVDGHESALSTPIVARIASPISAVQVVTGNHHACAILANREVICWGANEKGQVGDGSKTTWSLPVKVPNLRNVKSLEAKGDQTCAFGLDGAKTCWGVEGSVEEPRFKITKEISENLAIDGVKKGSESVAADFACAINAREMVMCWGANHLGQIGNGSGRISSAPQPVVF